MSKQKENSYLHLEDENLIDATLKQKTKRQKQKDAAQRIDMRCLRPTYKLVIGAVAAS